MRHEICIRTLKRLKCCTCILRLKKLSFWAAEASSWDRVYSLLPLKPPSLEMEVTELEDCDISQHPSQEKKHMSIIQDVLNIGNLRV